MTIIAGFDVSSSTTGWCILDVSSTAKTIVYIDSGYFKPIKEGSIFDKLSHSRDQVVAILDKYRPEGIAIEDVISFMKGHSTAKTIITLALFNRNVGMTSYDYLGKNPEMFSVIAIRHGIKTNKILPKKEEIPELAAQHLGIKFPYYYGKGGKIKTESYDVSDAFAVALYYAFVLTGKIKKKK
jgi:Holliday junction resolvasome RuvABC endonuclease subunit